MQKLQTLDYLVFLFYFIIVAGYGYWIYNKKKSAQTSTKDFFLAEGSLTWWAIGASLIASNISAEQMIGMSGNGFSMGLGISTYEWMAAATLIIVAVFFMPIYLKNNISTMPQFLSQRYNKTVSLIMAIFWLLLYIMVNLTSILYLGALAVSGISGLDFYTCMVFLAVFAIIITIGGMKVIGFTDVIQVFFLVIGGLAATYLAVTLVSEKYGMEGLATGFKLMTQNHDDHFHMIYPKGNPNYMSLPGLTVLFGGMWIVNLNYWGCNQYITQRALGADLNTARNGLLFAAFLKLLMPVIVTLPGIAAYALYQKGMFQQEMLGADGTFNQDRAYPVLLNLLPVGLKGLSFAALTAAVVASLAGKANSISTIFTLDVFRPYFAKDMSEKKLVVIGRIVIVISMILAIVISPFMGIEKKGGFQFIQEMTGLLSPGIFATFIMGFFWKKTNSAGAFFAIVGGFLIALSMHNNWLPGADWTTVPFLDRMGWVFVICVAVMFVLGLALPSENKGLEIDTAMFKTSKSFAIGATIVILTIVFLYTYFW
ncbi:SSS sodium solute transporter superfamily [Emticicia oligotrophica DSM 17448]|uniref:SSS sodium solute transporter superfamily n=1 Tax=Emticicia oligotrophica (strain DSM 17448 / CIP 109782 / MTCC 6937 / GPTSA100-15) TaxID=929562 RepID=A0ABN4AN41_EMTOG|nr:MULTISPECIES: sodium/solute symporter [Emticicia]AFK03819.1 SSS sodium solute transporter superfamily [Emticicia oligotrophica DSM 17448]